MSDFNNLHFLLQDQLFVIDGFELPEQETEASFEFYGENKKKILLLVAQQTADWLKTREYDLLLKIMAAVRNTPNEFALVNIATQETTWAQISDKLAPKTVIAFGLQDDFLPFQADLYQIGSEDTKQFLFAESLSVYVGDSTNEKKKQLWGALKHLFGV